MEQDFIDLLLGSAGITALVDRRIHWDELPQRITNPCIVMYRIDGVPDYHLQGASGLVRSRVQIDVRAESKLSASGVVTALETVLSAFTGTQGSTVFGGIFKTGERSRTDRPGQTTTYKLISMDFDVWHCAAS